MEKVVQVIMVEEVDLEIWMDIMEMIKLQNL